MSGWSHFNPVTIKAGRGSLVQLPSFVSEGQWLLVTTPGFTRRGLTARIQQMLGEQRLTLHDQITPNPELDDLESIIRQLAGMPFEGIVALGGGSVLDAAKILAVTLVSGMHNPLTQTLRGGQSQQWDKKLPLIAIPTTAGTGAEVTPFATVWDQSVHKKHSVTGELLYPDLALLDAELTLSLRRDETLYTGLDAISHALESLWNKNKTPISEALAWQALTLANEALPVVVEQPDNLNARETMQKASVLAGLAISQTRTAIAHSISYPLTSHHGVPHGLACSFTLPNILGMHLKYLSSSKAEYSVLTKIHTTLLSLDLSGKINSYISSDEMMALRSEMLNKGRADNFIFDIECLTQYLVGK